MKKVLVVISLFAFHFSLVCEDYGIQEAWDNPNMNMAAGSSKPGYAQLTWAAGTVLPIKLRNGMVTMVNLPAGETIEDGVVGNDGLFSFEPRNGGNSFIVTPDVTNSGGDTNLIVTGKSGNKYIFYLRAEPANSSEITYSQVDVALDGRKQLVVPGGGSGTGSMNGNVFARAAKTATGVDNEDYGWIKSMKINPSEFRFDLDIFVPNPDDYVIAPERVWRDRIFTYIDFGDKVIAMTQRPVVSLLIEGGESPVGFRTDGENGRLLIVEAVGDMVLRSGQRLVCIKRREKPFLVADTQSVMALAEANVMQSMASSQSLNNAAYYGQMPQYGQPAQIMNTNGYGVAPTMMMPVQQNYAPSGSGGGSGYNVNMVPQERNTAGAYLPQSNIPLISGAQSGVAVELRSDTSVKALNDYWSDLLARFSGDEGKGILNPYRNMVFFAVDETGVGELGADNNTARLYRLRVGPFADIDGAQKLCDQMLRFNGAACHVVRVQ
ncbi:MAG: TrbG/VirB9 family P-type conjugative transfer protein [Rickettsiales bacterium]|nr:TrbG/VirB9 family P-type conjugative transfer protein [Rickettsiales bacterium]